MVIHDNFMNKISLQLNIVKYASNVISLKIELHRTVLMPHTSAQITSNYTDI